MKSVAEYLQCYNCNHHTKVLFSTEHDFVFLYCYSKENAKEGIVIMEKAQSAVQNGVDLLPLHRNVFTVILCSRRTLDD